MFCTIALLVHTSLIDYLAGEAARTGFNNVHLRGVRIQLVLAAGLAVLTSIAAAALSVYKPPA